MRKNITSKVQTAPDATEIHKVKDYVKRNIVKVREGRKCVDGRYLPNQGGGMIARPGADGGYVMALAAVNRKKKLGLTPEECFNAVYKAVVKIGGKFYLHTDHHVDPSDGLHHGLTGCGHLAKAARRLYSREYDIRSRDVKKMVNYARNLSQIEGEVELVNLKGSHTESGILVINSSKYAVNSSNATQSKMFFVYDADRDNKFMEKLVGEMDIRGLTYKDMKKESDLQLETTLQNLALGLALFSVEIGEKGEVKVKPAGRVKQKPLIKRVKSIATTFYPSKAI